MNAPGQTGPGRVYVGRIDPGRLVEELRTALAWLGVERIVPSGARVFIKPNLTWKQHEPGVTTTPAFIAAAVEILSERTNRIMVGESDGGYHSFRADEAFETHGIHALAKRFGILPVNLSTMQVEDRSVDILGRRVTVTLPSLLLREVDVFVTLPVPKMHYMTRVSLGFKNQWGCQPGVMRLRNHPDLPWKVLAINQLVRPRLALFDGTYFLDRGGPLVGEPLPLGLVIASDDAGAGSLACCSIMGVDPWKSRHLRVARAAGMMPADLGSVTLNRPLEPFCGRRFTLRRSLVNYVALLASRSHIGTRLLYDSGIGELAHKVLYSIRGNRLVGRMLYGSLGPPEIRGRRG